MPTYHAARDREGYSSFVPKWRWFSCYGLIFIPKCIEGAVNVIVGFLDTKSGAGSISRPYVESSLSMTPLNTVIYLHFIRWWKMIFPLCYAISIDWFSRIARPTNYALFYILIMPFILNLHTLWVKVSVRVRTVSDYILHLKLAHHFLAALIRRADSHSTISICKCKLLF